MKTFFKWIGIIILSNFAGLLTIPFIYIGMTAKGFWPFMGAMLLCNIIARPVFGFGGAILGGMMKFTKTQWFWWVGLSIASIVFVFIDVDLSGRVILNTIFFGGYSLHMFFTTALLTSYEK